MTVSVLKQDPNTQKIQKNVYLLWQDTQLANFQGNLCHQATKQHLTVKWIKTMKNEMRKEITYLWFFQAQDTKTTTQSKKGISFLI